MSSPFDAEEPLNVHFVQSKGTVDDCSENMQMAFQVCMEQSLSPVWITEEKCLQMNPMKTDVFVCEEFEGQAFSYLKSLCCDCIVIGPRCILDCMGAGILIPKCNMPIFTVAMRNLVVTITGFTGGAEDLKADIIEKIQYMGGTYSAEYRQSITHVVAYKLLSTKYELALENKVPVMTEKWISAVWEESQKSNVHGADDEFKRYKCPIFHNMVITCSQLPRREKEEIKSMINSNGGSFSGQLQSNKTTMLIMHRPGGDKYSYARLWKLPCVKPSWIVDSVNKGYALPLDSYLLEGQQKCSTPESTAVTLPDISISHIHTSTTNIGETILDNTPVPCHSKSHKRNDSSPRTGLPYAQFIDELKMEDVKRAGAFLDGCNVYLSGFNAECTEKLRKVLNSGGAIRFNEISEGVTHIIVGDYEPADIKTIKSSHSRLHVVTVKWLLECIKMRSMAPEDQFSCYDALPSPIQQQSPLSKKGLLVLHSQKDKQHVRTLDISSPVGRKENLEPKNLVEQYMQSSQPSIAYVQDEDDKKDDDVTLLEVPKQTNNPSTSAAPSASGQSSLESCSAVTLSQANIFAGLKFSISGFDSEKNHDLEEIIKTCSGQVVKQKFSGIPDYGIVPWNGVGLKHTTTEVVTDLWVEDCFEEEQLMPVRYYHQPIHFDMDLKPLAGYVMSITSYTGMERRFISYLIEGLGGLNQAMFARVDSDSGHASTHLLCPDSSETHSSKKFKAAVKWGIPAVTHKWLLECAREGRKVDEGPYCIKPKSLDITAAASSSTGTTPHRSLKRRFDAGTPVGQEVGRSPMVTPNTCKDSPGDKSDPQTPKYKTPRAPGEISTPETPYGQVFGENPSPNTRKQWKKFVDRFPAFPQYKPSPPKQRRMSTPLSELKRRCWEKFGAGYYSVEENAQGDGDNSIIEVREANEVARPQEEGTPVRRAGGSASERNPLEKSREEDQNTSTPTSGAGINTQLLELNKILDTASRRGKKQNNSEESKPQSEPLHRGAPESLDVCGDFVEWVDPAVSSQIKTDIKKTPLFMLTSLDNREYYEDIIRSLGGVVSTKSAFEKDATHLVCIQPSRSEKLLSCIASGKWVLEKSYLDDSKKAGRFLEEEPYEWGNPKASSLMSSLKPGSLNVELAKAVYRWRCKINETGAGAFAGMKVILCTSEEKTPVYARLIEAGDGEVLRINPPYSEPGNATLCIIEFSKVNCRVDLESLARHNVPCVPALYLNNYLIYDPCPDARNCLLAEYQAVLSKI